VAAWVLLHCDTLLVPFVDGSSSEDETPASEKGDLLILLVLVNMITFVLVFKKNWCPEA
jgi:hypothetical protein